MAGLPGSAATYTMQNRHLLHPQRKINTFLQEEQKATGLEDSLGLLVQVPTLWPHRDQGVGVFLVQFSTEAGENTLFPIAQALDSCIAGVLLMPHWFLSIGCAWGVLTLCCGEEQDRQSWKPLCLTHPSLVSHAGAGM